MSAGSLCCSCGVSEQACTWLRLGLTVQHAQHAGQQSCMVCAGAGSLLTWGAQSRLPRRATPAGSGATGQAEHDMPAWDAVSVTRAGRPWVLYMVQGRSYAPQVPACGTVKHGIRHGSAAYPTNFVKAARTSGSFTGRSRCRRDTTHLTHSQQARNSMAGLLPVVHAHALVTAMQARTTQATAAVKPRLAASNILHALHVMQHWRNKPSQGDRRLLSL